MKNPGATTKPKLPQQEFNPISPSGGTSLRHRASAGSQQVDSRENDAKCSLPEDVATYISTDREGVNIDRMVIVTMTGMKFHYHVNCYGLRKSTSLSLMDLRKTEGMAPCTVCTGAPSGRD